MILLKLLVKELGKLWRKLVRSNSCIHDDFADPFRELQPD